MSNLVYKKRILHIVEAMGGGIFTYMVDLINQLCNDFDVYLAYAVRPQTPTDYKKHFDSRVHMIEVKNFTRSVNLSKDIKAYLEIITIAKKVQPDIIHLHSSKAGALGRWAFNGHRTHIFYTPHGYSFLMQDASSIKKTFYKLIELISGKRLCTTIACSKGEYEESLKLTKFATYINNGINIERMLNLIDVDTSNEPHQLTVFTLGRICYQKNPELFNRIAAKMPDIKFLWIGDGELSDRLTSPNIEITGWVNRKKALEYSKQADIFILTSLWEGLPISLIEAMYLKKTCLVSDVIGNRDVIENGRNGFICKSEDDYIFKIMKLKSSKDKQVIDNAYNDVLNEYNTVVMTKKYKDVYSSH